MDAFDFGVFLNKKSEIKLYFYGLWSCLKHISSIYVNHSRFTIYKEIIPFLFQISHQISQTSTFHGKQSRCISAQPLSSAHTSTVSVCSVIYLRNLDLIGLYNILKHSPRKKNLLFIFFFHVRSVFCPRVCSSGMANSHTCHQHSMAFTVHCNWPVWDRRHK